MTTIQSAAPYYDDFDEYKNYHQILFRPGYSVQARELTQIQSILRNQIAKFGSHIFRQGSVVIPGNSFSELDVPYVTVEPTYLGNALNLSLFEEKVLVGQSSGVKAIVKKALGVSGADPVTLYLSYTSGGTTAGVPNGKLVFDAGEVLVIETQTAVAATSISIGNGAMAYVNKGVYYINGTFVSTDKQSVVISKYTKVPSCHVLFKINEEAVDETSDQTLLDPAQGSYNFAAPGADRLKLSLELVSLPLGSALTEDYVELMRYDNGELLEHFNTPKYSELEKSLAQRTYDESGDYVVRGFNIRIREHKKDSLNGGLLADGDYGKFVYELSSGKAYVSGLAIENLASKRFITDKARTLSHVTQNKVTIKPSWGQYLMVADPQGTLNIQARETVQLWNISAISGGSQIGTAKVIGLDYLVGDGSAHPIYKLFVSDMILTSGSYDDIGSIRLASANFSAKVVGEYSAPVTSGAFVAGDIVTFNSTDRVATVSFYDSSAGMLYAHKHSGTSSPKTGDTIAGPSATATISSKTMIGKSGKSELIFALPNSATKALKDATNTFDMEFTQWVVLSIAAGATTVSSPSGILVPIEAGTFIALTNTGPDSRSNYSLGSGGSTVTRSSGAPAGGVTIYCQVQKNAAAPRTKSSAIHSGTYSASNMVYLSHADVYSITSIVSSGVDITSRYQLNSGQTDFEYGISSIKLKPGFTTPSGLLVVSYKYFAHSVGDFFSVDSYPLSLDNDMIPTYSSSSGASFLLRDCLDFRKTVGMVSNVVVPDTFITTSSQNYVPRIDVACLDRQGSLVVISGTPATNPKLPVVPSTLYPLEAFRVPAFTYKLEQIKPSRIAVTRYTMEKVAALETRIKNIEQFSLMTAAEAQATNTPFVDAATGLDRFKTGYLVESMQDPFQIAQTASTGFTASINSKFGITAKMEEDVISLSPVDSGIGVINTMRSTLITQSSTEFVNSSVYNTNGVFSLPYYDKVFASVGVSSKITNINPFSVIGWNGNLSIVPSSDVWVDVLDRPEIVNDITNTINTSETVYTTVWLPAPMIFPPPARVEPIAPPVFVAGPVATGAPTNIAVFGPPALPALVEPVVVAGPLPAEVPVEPVILSTGQGTSDATFNEIATSPVVTWTDGEGGEWSWYDNGMNPSSGDSFGAAFGGADPGGDGGYSGYY